MLQGSFSIPPPSSKFEDSEGFTRSSRLPTAKRQADSGRPAGPISQRYAENVKPATLKNAISNPDPS